MFPSFFYVSFLVGAGIIAIICARFYAAFAEKRHQCAQECLGDMPIMQWLTMEDLEQREFDPVMLPFAIEYLYDCGFLEIRRRSQIRPLPNEMLFRPETVMYFEFRHVPPPRVGNQMYKRFKKFASQDSSTPNPIEIH